jgi:hypothetical protein
MNRVKQKDSLRRMNAAVAAVMAHDRAVDSDPDWERLRLS